MKRFIRRSLRKCGWELRRFRPNHSEWAQVRKLLDDHCVTVVVDVGANTGQYAKNLRDAGFQRRIISIEPSFESHALLARAARADALWEVLPPLAVGDRNGFVDLNISQNRVSSSVLPMLSAHLEADPQSQYVSREHVAITTLDALEDKYLDQDDVIFLKLDVQGFESQVLAGAIRLLKRVTGLQVELSLIPLYRGQILFDEIISNLRTLGFELWSLIPGFVNEDSGRLLQIDGIFLSKQNENK